MRINSGVYGLLPIAMLSFVPCVGQDGARQIHRISVSRCPSVQLTEGDARQILKRAERILCAACTKPHSQDNCPLSLELDKMVDLGGDELSSFHDGRVSEADVKHLILEPGGGWMYGPRHYVYLVGLISWCGPEKEAANGGTILGCSSRPGNIMLIGLSESKPELKGAPIKEWYFRQALIWAHELGHNLGLCHSKAPFDLMNADHKTTSVHLSPAECDVFAGPPRVR